jgi:3-oxoacyl-[acyl-carrier-protein] synthase-3
MGTGSALPEKVLTNDDLSRMVDTSDEWIVQRTGIRARHIASDKEATSDFATVAAKRALAAADIGPKEVDHIVLATITADYQLPSTGCVVQAQLGATQASAFDLQAACSGFIYATEVARRLVEGSPGSTALVIGAETLSRFTDWDDRTSCILFGDGAGAMVLRSLEDAPDGRGILRTRLFADGTGADLMITYAGMSRQPITREMLELPPEKAPRPHKMLVRGNEVFRFAVNKFAELVTLALRENSLGPDDIKMIVPHQVNQRIVDAAMRRCDVTPDRVFLNLDRVGNTGGASIPIALDDAVRQGLIVEGDYVLFVSFGGGLTWAYALVRW